MNGMLERRSFLKTMALGLGHNGIALVQPPSPRRRPPLKKLKIGHTCITWGTFPPAGR